jgi:RecA-family ATPase
MAKSTRRKLRKYNLLRMATEDPPPVPWVVEPIAAKGEVTVLFGPSGVGKSLLSLGVCNCVGRGKPFAGLRCRRGRALYFDAENGEYEVHRRVQALDVEPKRVAIYDAAGFHLVNDAERIDAAIEEQGAVALVVFDSLRALLPGTEENDSGAMAEALARCRRFAQSHEVAVVVIHHTKKDKETMRGSQAIEDQCSVVYGIKRTPGDIDRLRRVLSNEKMRIAPEQRELYLRIGIEDAEFVAESADEPGDEEIVKGSAQPEVIEQVVAHLEDGPKSRPSIAKLLGRKKNDGTIRRALDTLTQQDRVEEGDDRKWRLVKEKAASRQSSKKKRSGDSRKSSHEVVGSDRAATTPDDRGVARSDPPRRPPSGNRSRKRAKKGSN